MFGPMIKEREKREKVDAALISYTKLSTIFDEFWRRCCSVFTEKYFDGAIKCIDKKARVFSIMGFLITSWFIPVADDSGKIFGKIIFKHESTELCRILFDASGRVLSQTCSSLSFCNMLDSSGFESLIYDFIEKFIYSDVMKEKDDGN